MSRNVKTKAIVFSGALIALATVIANYIKLPSLPFGGSVTLFSMLLVSLCGYLFGPTVGLCAAIAHGLIQFASNPYAIHPLQVLLDYPLAFGALGLSGFFKDKKHGLIKGYTIGVLGRFVFASLSGAIFYTEYVGDFIGSATALFAGILYNMTYIFPEYVLTVIILLVPAVSKAIGHIRKIAS